MHIILRYLENFIAIVGEGVNRKLLVSECAKHTRDPSPEEILKLILPVVRLNLEPILSQINVSINLTIQLSTYIR